MSKSLTADQFGLICALLSFTIETFMQLSSQMAAREGGERVPDQDILYSMEEISMAYKELVEFLKAPEKFYIGTGDKQAEDGIKRDLNLPKALSIAHEVNKTLRRVREHQRILYYLLARNASSDDLEESSTSLLTEVRELVSRLKQFIRHFNVV